MLKLEEDVALARFTTFGVGGPARFYARVTSEDELLEGVRFAKREGLPLVVLGGGSNLLVADEGFRGLVLHMAIAGEIVVRRERDSIEVSADAGVDWDTLVLGLCQQGISGMECLAGIPGTVGGTPVQNVGAYGQEVAQTISRVRALDLKAPEAPKFVELTREQCGFGYRTSIFNGPERGRYVVTKVIFRMDEDARPNLTYKDLREAFAGQTPSSLEVYQKVREIRHTKGMLLVAGEQDCRSAGSFFKNPVVSGEQFAALVIRSGAVEAHVPHWKVRDGRVKLAAAWLVEQAGFGKGYRLGRAGISSRHTLALINLGGATFSDVVRLRERILDQVEQRFGVKLEQEPIELG